LVLTNPAKLTKVNCGKLNWFTKSKKIRLYFLGE
jgi:hypothetical protein